MVLKAKYRRPDGSLTLREAAEICLKCGICCVVSGHSCHVMYDREKFDPKHTFVYECLGANDPAANPNIWLCVSCHKCEEICPYEVSPIDFIEAMKPLAFERGHAHTTIVFEVENVLSTGYAFTLTPAAARLREELGLDPLTVEAADDIESISEKTGLAQKLSRLRERGR